MQRIPVIGSSGTGKSTLALKTPAEVRAFLDGLPESMAKSRAEAA